MKLIKRILQGVIDDNLFKGKAVLIVGARQVGKSTLFRQIIENKAEPVLSLNCDEPEVKDMLTNMNSTELRMLIGKNKIILIDEAQRVEGIGLTMKRITDNFPDVQLLITGSSSFYLHGKLDEPLTGRKYEYNLFPISTEELIESGSFLDVKQSLESRLIYGSYPDVLNNKEDAKELLMNLSDSYLYKDILAMDGVRKPVLLEKILVALALQVGSEVSYNEVAQTVGSDPKTVEKYIDLLEKCFVLFRMQALSRNLRTELKKSKKIYFYDNGIRNAILQNFSPLSLRNDAGALWENFFISERIKFNHYHKHYVKTYFWRTTQQQEIDYIEEEDGLFSAFEMKWNPKRSTTALPETFTKSYPLKTTAIITRDNYIEWLIEKQH